MGHVGLVGKVFCSGVVAGVCGTCCGGVIGVAFRTAAVSTGCPAVGCGRFTGRPRRGLGLGGESQFRFGSRKDFISGLLTASLFDGRVPYALFPTFSLSFLPSVGGVASSCVLGACVGMALGHRIKIILLGRTNLTIVGELKTTGRGLAVAGWQLDAYDIGSPLPYHLYSLRNVRKHRRNGALERGLFVENALNVVHSAAEVVDGIPQAIEAKEGTQSIRTARSSSASPPW